VSPAAFSSVSAPLNSFAPRMRHRSETNYRAISPYFVDPGA